MSFSMALDKPGSLLQLVCNHLIPREERKKLNKQTNKQFYLKGLIINDTFKG